jgi:hypothetical protein
VAGFKAPGDNNKQIILDELKAQGINWHINRYGLKVRGKRTTWQEAYWIAFLGWKKGMAIPKIVKTYYKEAA